MILCVIWVVVMILWLFGGGYIYYEPAKPHMIGAVLLPWVCVLILGLIIFGAVNPGPVVVRN